MLEIKGNFNYAKVFTDSIDSGSEGLIKAFLNSEISENTVVRFMPDVHAGKGCCVGTTIKLNEKIVPGLIGTDIGCGVEALKVKIKRLEFQKLDKIIREKIPSGFNIRVKPHRYANLCDGLGDMHCAKHINAEKTFLSLGTLGGGNHFIEIDKANDGYYLIIHSGSRHLGAEVEKFYHELAYSKTKDKVPYEFAYLEGDDAKHYLSDINVVKNYAHLNRMAIADEIIQGMKMDVDEENSISCPHNYIDFETGILRKGAIEAQNGQKVIIPLNMRDGCLICEGFGNEDWNFSAPHGAGRLYNRAESKSMFTLSQFKKEMKNVYSPSISHDTLDEAPMVYKNSDDIETFISPAVKILERIVPIYNFKAGTK